MCKPKVYLKNVVVNYENVIFLQPFTVGSGLLDAHKFLPLDPTVDTSCKIEHCGNRMQRIVANMIMSQHLLPCML